MRTSVLLFFFSPSTSSSAKSVSVLSNGTFTNSTLHLYSPPCLVSRVRVVVYCEVTGLSSTVVLSVFVSCVWFSSHLMAVAGLVVETHTRRDEAASPRRNESSTTPIGFSVGQRCWIRRSVHRISFVILRINIVLR